MDDARVGVGGGWRKAGSNENDKDTVRPVFLRFIAPFKQLFPEA
jgi:hypothetical protein